MKRYLVLILIGLVTLLSAIPLLASVVSSAEYQTTVTITNNSSTAISNGIVPFNLSTSEMIDAGMLSANASDCAMKDTAGNDVAFMPSVNSTVPWLTFVPYIGANSQLKQYLYSKGATGGKLCYFPCTAGMTVTDNNSNLEIGDNFTIEMKGWVDTTLIGANLTSKEGAFRTYIASTGNITSAILSQQTSPTSASGTGWANTENAWDDNVTSYATSNNVSGVTYTTYLQFNHSALYCNSVFFKVGRSDASITEVDVDAYYSGNWTNVYEGAGDWGNWQETNLNTIESVTAIRIRFYNTADNAHYGKVYEVDFGQSVLASATGISSRDMRVVTSADSDNLTIAVYDASDALLGSGTVALNGTTVTPNNNDWIFFQNNVMPYIEYLKIWR